MSIAFPYDPVAADVYRYGRMCSLDDVIEARARQMAEDPDYILDAATQKACETAEELGGEAFAALYALHHKHPDDLMGSQVLTDLYQIARKVTALIEEQIEQYAIWEIEREGK